MSLLFFFLPAALWDARASFPPPRGLLNDFAHVVSGEKQARIDSLLREILTKTGTAVVVVTLPDVGGDDPDMAANELYRAWGIGKKGEDKGVLIFLALEERRIRIETGYGVEGILPDRLVGEILDQHVVPLLKKGDYGGALFNGALAVGQVIARDSGVTLTGQAPTKDFPRKKKENIPISLLVAFIVVYLLLRYFLGGGRRIERGGFGGFGGGFGGFGGGLGGGGFGGFGGGLSGGGGIGRGF